MTLRRKGSQLRNLTPNLLSSDKKMGDIVYGLYGVAEEERTVVEKNQI